MNFAYFEPAIRQISSTSPREIMLACQRLDVDHDHTSLTAVYVYDLESQHSWYVSLSLLELLGYRADYGQKLGSIGIASLIHPDDLDAVADYYQYLGTLQENAVFTLDYRMLRANGRWSLLRSQDTLLTTSIEGWPKQILGCVQEIPVPTPALMAGGAMQYSQSATLTV